PSWTARTRSRAAGRRWPQPRRTDSRPRARRPAVVRRAPLLTPAFGLCALANFTQSLAFNLYLHLPGFLHGLGASEVQIGLLFGATAAAAIAVRPLLARAIDRG